MAKQPCRITSSKKVHRIHYQYLCIFLTIFFLYSCGRSYDFKNYEKQAREEKEAGWCKNYRLNCPEDLHNPSSIPILINATENDPQCDAQAWALTELSKIKPRSEKITSLIVQSLKESNCEYKLLAAMEMAPTIGNRINEVIPDLINYIENKTEKYFFEKSGEKYAYEKAKYSGAISEKAAILVGNIELSDEQIIASLKQKSTRKNYSHHTPGEIEAATKSYRKLSSLVIKSTEPAEVTTATIPYNPPPQPRIRTDQSEPVQFKKRIALIIGNANYKNAGILANPVNDAKAIEKALKSLNFVTLPCPDCDLNKMKRAIQNFSNLSKDYDVRLFFYAGHGVQVDGENYFLPTDVTLNREQDVELECLRMDYLIKLMEMRSSGINIIMMDACRTNPFERGWHRGPIGRGLAPPKVMPTGSIISFSTSPNKVALDGYYEPNSPYTAAVVQCIVENGINIETLFKKVRKAVLKKTNNEQRPWESTSLTEDFYFNR